MADSLRDLVVSLSLNTDNFTRNIKSVNKQIQEAESYFKLASAGIKDFDTSAAGLTSKLEMLERKLTLQRDDRRNVQTVRVLSAAGGLCPAPCRCKGPSGRPPHGSRDGYARL